MCVKDKVCRVNAQCEKYWGDNLAIPAMKKMEQNDRTDQKGSDNEPHDNFSS